MLVGGACKGELGPIGKGRDVIITWIGHAFLNSTRIHHDHRREISLDGEIAAHASSPWRTTSVASIERRNAYMRLNILTSAIDLKMARGESPRLNRRAFVHRSVKCHDT
jgi:hypothetical protein